MLETGPVQQTLPLFIIFNLKIFGAIVTTNFLINELMKKLASLLPNLCPPTGMEIRANSILGLG